MSAIWSASSSTRDLDRVERADAALDQVAQAARGGDEDVDAALEGADLRSGTAHRRTRSW